MGNKDFLHLRLIVLVKCIIAVAWRNNFIVGVLSAFKKKQSNCVFKL